MSLSTLRSPSQLVFLHPERDGRFSARHVFTNVNVLANERYTLEAIDLEKSKVLVLMFLYYKNAKQDDKKVSIFSKVGKSSSSVNFERMAVFFDPIAPEGENVINCLLGCGQNPNFFSRYLNERDTGVFSECLV